jgi:hypothetical protein
MNLASKLYILDQIYSISDDFSAQLDLACKKNCADCCTTHVIVTTLEGYKIISSRASNQKADLIQKVKSDLTQKRFQPKITTNHLATLCAQGIDPRNHRARRKEVFSVSGKSVLNLQIEAFWLSLSGFPAQLRRKRLCGNR